jgi:ribonuclease HII
MIKNCILGIDEAGRGCVLGPLVVCGFALRREDLPALEALGLRDSKALSPARREELDREIRKLAGTVLLMKIPPYAVDSAVSRNGLNSLEISAMVRLIRRVKPEEAFIDALTSNPRRFGSQLSGLVAPLKPRLVAENRADSKYPIVMAASILAKVARDSSIERLRRIHGDIGSGYPGDPKTRRFLSRYAGKGDFPACVRRSWSTLDRVRAGMA